eukprot:scaffold1429_cov110-Cylindrotheca_fusiformis.AAC.5
MKKAQWTVGIDPVISVAALRPMQLLLFHSHRQFATRQELTTSLRSSGQRSAGTRLRAPDRDP